MWPVLAGYVTLGSAFKSLDFLLHYEYISFLYGIVRNQYNYLP